MPNNVPMWIEDKWNQTVTGYMRFLDKMTYPWNGACKNVNLCASMTVDYPQLQPQRNAALRKMKLAEDIRNRLLACAADSKVRIAIVFVHLKYKNENDTHSGGHALLLVFDLRAKTYQLFDPDSSTDSPNWTAAYAQENPLPPLLPGFTAITQGLEWQHSHQRLQRRFEQEDLDHKGVCGVLTSLVALLCLRFGISNPKAVADLLAATYTTGNTRRFMMMRFITFMEDNRGMASATLAPKLVPDTDGTCSVVSATSLKPCSRKTCMGLCYCWQHNHILRNPYALSKKCAAVWQPHYVF